MKKKPVIANPIAIRRRPRTTKRSVFSPLDTSSLALLVVALTRRHPNWLFLRGCAAAKPGATRLTLVAVPMIRAVIDRDQVLHVARLARLKLTDEEIERMSGELSGILEHVDRISELDLDDVEPTSHVIALENVLRPDEPRPSWSRDEMLDPAPDPASGAFRVPSPQA